MSTINFYLCCVTIFLLARDGLGLSTTEPRDAETSNSVCKPGLVFEKSCNTCTCSDDGKKVTCTKNFCGNVLYDMIRMDPYQKSDTEKPHHIAKRQEKKKACIPNSEFRKDCERCLCNDDGSLFSCTRKGCN